MGISAWAGAKKSVSVPQPPAPSMPEPTKIPAMNSAPTLAPLVLPEEMRIAMTIAHPGQEEAIAATTPTVRKSVSAVTPLRLAPDLKETTTGPTMQPVWVFPSRPLRLGEYERPC